MFRDKCDEIIRYDNRSPEIIYLKSKDKNLAAVIDSYGPLEYKLYKNDYLFFVHAFIGQMLSNKVADVISKRFSDMLSSGITPESVSNLNREELRAIGLSYAKSDYIINFSRYILENPRFFDDIQYLQDDEIIKKLTVIRGIGNWSAKMYLIFVLNRLDVLPYEDGAFIQAYKWLYGVDEKNRNHPIIRKECLKWSPYSSIAARYLYRILDNGTVKQDITTFLNTYAK